MNNNYAEQVKIEAAKMVLKEIDVAVRTAKICEVTNLNTIQAEIIKGLIENIKSNGVEIPEEVQELLK